MGIELVARIVAAYDIIQLLFSACRHLAFSGIIRSPSNNPITDITRCEIRRSGWPFYRDSSSHPSILHNDIMGGSPGDVSEEPVTQEMRKKGWRMSCDVGEVMGRLVCSFSILQPFRHFTQVTPHSPTLPLLHLRHSSFSGPSFSSPTSQALHLRHLASRP